MIRTLTDWMNLTTTTAQDEWNIWREWQRHQSPSHYEKSDIFQYYLSKRPCFQPPIQSCAFGHGAKYYVYCFGDFTTLMVNPTAGNVIEYLIALLDVYDVCKGYSRHLKGDPTGIAIIREVIQKKTLVPLEAHDFTQYSYEYNVIHAHTVAQYSLSTLLMKLLGNYMSHISAPGYHTKTELAISLLSCRKAYDSCIFGAPMSDKLLTTPNQNVVSNTIAIEQRRQKTEDFRGYSWPSDRASCMRCKICSRVTENTWGLFYACLDCHLKRICSKCGKAAVIIGSDNFPKCYHHQLEQ